MNLKSKICNWQKGGLQMANIIIYGGGFQAAAAASKAASQAGKEMYNEKFSLLSFEINIGFADCGFHICNPSCLQSCSA